MKFAFYIVISFFITIKGARILLNTANGGFNSRLLRMNDIASILSDEGHEVYMVLPDFYKEFPEAIDSRTHIMEYTVTGNKKISPSIIKAYMSTIEMTWYQNTFRYFHRLVEGILGTESAALVRSTSSRQLMLLLQEHCQSIISNQYLMKRFKDLKFDVAVYDALDQCSPLLTDWIDVPTIIYTNYGFGTEHLYLHFWPLSFVPITHSDKTDQMNFVERFQNVIAYSDRIINLKWPSLRFYSKMKQLYKLNESVSASTAFIRSDPVVLVGTDFVYDYPRPIAPNNFLIGSLFMKSNSTITWPEHLQRFLDSVDESGFLLVSFGTLFNIIPDSTLNSMAAAFARLPVRVLWRYDVRRPERVGNNTYLTDQWLPQYSLLQHSSIRAVMSHCGASSTREILYGGVPVVAMPLVADQHHQALGLANRVGMAVVLEFHTLTEESVYSALIQILSNDSYRNAAKRASVLLKHQLYNSKDILRFWVNYSAVYGRPSHLQLHRAHDLNVIQYWLIDIFLILFAAIALSMTLIVCSCKSLCKNFFISKKGQRKQHVEKKRE